MTKYLLLTIDNEISRGRSSWGKISKRRTETEAGRRRIKSVPRALVINRGRRENGRPGGKWTVQLGESGRSKAPKVDGPGFKWTVQNEIKWAVQKRKVDGPQKMKLDVGGQKGMKVDGLKMRGGQKGMKVDGPQKCVEKR